MHRCDDSNLWWHNAPSQLECSSATLTAHDTLCLEARRWWCHVEATKVVMLSLLKPWVIWLNDWQAADHQLTGFVGKCDNDCSLLIVSQTLYVRPTTEKDENVVRVCVNGISKAYLVCRCHVLGIRAWSPSFVVYRRDAKSVLDDMPVDATYPSSSSH